MNKKSITLVRLIIIIIIIVCSLILFFKLNLGKTYTSKMDTVTDGTINLKNKDLDSEIVKLNGKWKFYNNKLIEPQDFNIINANESSTFKIPNDYKNFVCGTFRLKVIVKDINKIYAVYIPFVQSSYKLWVDNKLLTQVGKVSENENEIEPEISPQICEFKPDRSEFYITMQVSNYHYRTSYVDQISFGQAKVINDSRSKTTALNLMAFGAGCVTALYCFFTFANRKREKDLFYYAVLSLIICVRVLFLESKSIFIFFPNMQYLVYEKIVYCLEYIYIPIIVLYVDSVDYKINRWIKKAAVISILVYTILIIAAPCRFFIYIVFPFTCFSLVVLLYIIFGYCKKYIKTEEWKISTSAGRLKIIIDSATLCCFTLLFIVILTNLLYRLSRIETLNFDPVSVFCFLIITAYIVASRQAKYFNELQNMGSRLKKLNKLKDDFLAITTHDLKNPLSGIIELSKDLYDSKKFTGQNKKELWLINITAVRLLNLVNDILIFTRLNTNDIVLNNEAVNIYKLVDLVILMNTVNGKK